MSKKNSKKSIQLPKLYKISYEQNKYTERYIHILGQYDLAQLLFNIVTFDSSLADIGSNWVYGAFRYAQTV